MKIDPNRLISISINRLISKIDKNREPSLFFIIIDLDRLCELKMILIDLVRKVWKL